MSETTGKLLEWMIVSAFFLLVIGSMFAEAFWLSGKGWASFGKSFAFSALSNFIGFSVGLFVFFVMLKTEPFGEDYATFVVNKNDSNDAVAADFVERFGWHIDEDIAPEKISLEIPVNFDGAAFSHYQSASKSSGFDLTALQGKTVELMKYTLKEKQSDNGREFKAFACLIIENGKVVGAWRTDSSSRVPGIYSFAEK